MSISAKSIPRISRKAVGSFSSRTFASSPDQLRPWRAPEQAHPAKHYTKLGVKDAVQCHLSPRHCKILPGKFGYCGVRGNKDGELVTYNFGRSVQAALETIETEAVYHYEPGASILSLGNIGCMMSCTFCHNWQTSQVKHLKDKSVHHYTPEQVVENALENNIGILSWTYNDPVVWHEFVCRTAELGQKHGIKSLYKSAFYIEKEPIDELIDVIDIFSLSLKSMDEEFYKRVCKGRLEPVLRGIEQVHKSGRHLEVSQLLVTDMNDTEEQCRKTAKWQVEALSPDVPLHFVRFHPAFEYTSVDRTPLERLYAARDIAKEEGVKHVYIGNVYEPGTADTKCHHCGSLQVRRFGLTVDVCGIDKETNNCLSCGAPADVKNAHEGLRFSKPMKTGSTEQILSSAFDESPEKLSSNEVTWTKEVNSVHVVFPGKSASNKGDDPHKLVVIKEPLDETTVISKPLGRVILSRGSSEETGVRVFAKQPFELYTVLDRAHFPVFSNEKDGEGPMSIMQTEGNKPFRTEQKRMLSTSTSPSTLKNGEIQKRKFSSSALSSAISEEKDIQVKEDKHVDTILVRSKPDISEAKPISTPVFQTGAFESGDPYFYTRASNPNFEDVEKVFTNLDSAKDSVLLSSGMAAISGVLTNLKAGDRVVANKLLYGCSFRFLTDYCKANDLVLDFVDLCDPKARQKALTSGPAPNAVFFETPTNPFLKTVSISEVSKEAKSANENCLVVVDNTWATPLFQRPLEQGADVAIYSCSKFFSGHSDLILGIVSCFDDRLLEQFRHQRFYHGAVPDPFAAWLLRRSLQTLSLRMDAHIKNTEKVAAFLRSSECSDYVEQVFLPEVDGDQLSAYGGLLFFRMRNDPDGSKSDVFADNLELFDRGTPMATVRSAVAIPYTGSHASMTDEEKQNIGLGRDVVRLSVGIENVNDLIKDLKESFSGIHHA